MFDKALVDTGADVLSFCSSSSFENGVLEAVAAGDDVRNPRCGGVAVAVKAKGVLCCAR